MSRIRKNILFILCLTAFGLSLQAQTKVTVHPDNHYTVIEGWGSSLCWWANMVGKWNNDAKIDELVDILTSPDKLNMNIFRYNIGGGDNPSHTHLKGDPRVDMPGFKAGPDAPYDWDADYAQRKIMLKIKKKRPDAIFEAFSNSPPYWMTYSGCSSGNTNKSDDNLKPEYYDAFCDYLIDVCKYYKDTYGLEFKTLEPFNEAASSYWGALGSQEGCHFSASSQMNLLRKLYPKLQASGLNTVISASDETNLSTFLSVTNSYINAGDILDKIGQLNVHTYSGSDPERSSVYDLVSRTGKPFWQSESGNGGSGYTANLQLLQRMFSDMNEMRPAAWLDWQFMEQGNDTWCLVRGTGAWTSENYTLIKNYYVRMQVTRFMKQGYTVIESGNRDVLAAISPDREELVISLINNSGAARRFDFNLSDFYPVYAPVKVYRTSASENCSPLADMDVSGSVLSYNAANQTITTFVLKAQPISRSTFRITEGIAFEDGNIDGFSGTNLLVVDNSQANLLNVSEKCLSGGFDSDETIVYSFEKLFNPTEKFRYLHVMVYNPSVEAPVEDTGDGNGTLYLNAWKEWKDLVFDLNASGELDHLVFTGVPGTCMDNLIINGDPVPRSITQQPPVFDYESPTGTPLYEFRNPTGKKSSGSVIPNLDFAGLNALGNVFRYVFPSVENSANAEDTLAVKLSSPLIITDETRYLHVMIKSSLCNKVDISVSTASESPIFAVSKWVDLVVDLYRLKNTIVREIKISPYGQKGLNSIVYLDNICFNSNATPRVYTYKAPENNKPYVIISRNSGLAITPSGSGVVQDDVDMTLEDETQQWVFVSVSGGYNIYNKKSSSLYITNDGSYALALKTKNTGSQVFTLSHLGDGYVRINSSSKVFDVNGASTSVGATIGVYDWKTSSNTNQQWSLIEGKEIETPPPPAKSDNANLSSLSVSPGMLTPSFDPEITSYAVDVDNSTVRITVTAASEDSKAKLTGTGTHSLKDEVSTINVVVTAEDGTTQKTYTIVVTREIDTEIVNGVEDNLEQSIIAYPNPAKNQVTISGLQGNGVLTVYDITGKQWLYRNIANPQETIDVSALPAGNYSIRVIEGKRAKVIKIIVE